MTTTNKQTKPTQKTEETYNDHPIITYSNRIQKHLYQLTKELSQNDTIETSEKRQLKLIIFNLPPQAKQKLSHITPQLENQEKPLTTKEFDKLYSEVSDWIYTNILQDAFKVKPLNTETPHLGTEEQQQED